MDNSHNDYTRKKAVTSRFNRSKPVKVKTKMGSDGRETIVSTKHPIPVKRGNRIIEKKVTVPQIKKPLQVKTRMNADGSEQIIAKNQPISQVKKRVMARVKKVATIKPTVKMRNPLKRAAMSVKGLNTKGVKKSVGAETLKFINPLTKTMKIGLAAKGLNTKNMTQAAIIEKFYNEFVSKKNDKYSEYDEIPEGEIQNHYLFSTDYDSFDSDNFLGLAAISKLVNVGKGITGKIKGFVAKKKAAKQAGQNANAVMAEEEARMAAEAEKLVKKLEEEKAAAELVTKQESKKNIIKYIIYAVVGVAFIALGVYAIKKK